MSTCLIIHGVSCNSQENCLPLLKRELERRGWKALALSAAKYGGATLARSIT